MYMHVVNPAVNTDSLPECGRAAESRMARTELGWPDNDFFMAARKTHRSHLISLSEEMNFVKVPTS